VRFTEGLILREVVTRPPILLKFLTKIAIRVCVDGINLKKENPRP
jgi:hypothetical protein